MTNDRAIAVVGLGRSGVAAVHHLLDRGERVLACDDHAAPQAAAGLAVLDGVTLVTGGLPLAELSQCREILLSPGVPREHPVIQAALAAGVPVVNDVEWLHRAVVAAGERPLFVGITGTNGKSTVTTLVGLMLEAAGKRVVVGGNLGQPALSLLTPGADVYVLELSSYQLESLDTARLNVAVLINITPDHMDRYHAMAPYRAAKRRIFRNQGEGDRAVVNMDDPEAALVARELPAERVIPVSAQREILGGVHARGDLLIDHRRDMPRVVVELTTLRNSGVRANAAIAAAAALEAGATIDAVAQVLQTFPGLPHRVEWVRELDGVGYYNDSKGTNVDAVIHSLAGFPGGVVLIAGGRDKAGDFAALIPLIRERVSGLVLIGEAATAMEQAWQGLAPIQRADGMTGAVALARGLARPGGVVLLSPACASFDMFKNFEDRGDQFREAVHGL